MNASLPRRVRYFDGQDLSVADFVDEQHYHIAAGQRHNSGLHSWGIAYGLDITAAPAAAQDQWRFTIGAGLAIDGHGREIALEQPLERTLNIDLLRQQAVTAVDVLIHYRQEKTLSADRRYYLEAILPGDPGAEAETDYDRWDESPSLQLKYQRQSDKPLPARNTLHSERGDAEGGMETDDERPWPVLLARIILPATPSLSPAIERSGRRYVGLIGDTVRPVKGRAHLSLGTDSEHEQACFAVHLDNGEATTGEDSAPPNGVEPATEGTAPLWIDWQGGVHLTGGVDVKGGLRLSKGAMRFPEIADRAPDETGWQIYRARNEATGVEEMRIELPDRENGAEVAIGNWNTEESRLDPVLSVRADGTVVVAGNLQVNGLINPPPHVGEQTQGDRMVASAKLSAINAAASAAASEEIREQAEKKAQSKSLAAWLAAILKRVFGLFGLGPDGRGN